jgi:hypothetical protein
MRLLSQLVASAWSAISVQHSGAGTAKCAVSLPVLLLLLLLQIFVEIERARLTRKLAAMREAEGNIAEAADILQEVAVVSSCGSCVVLH